MSLKIAFLTYSTKPRGSVVHTCELAIALTELGHHVCIYALDKDGFGLERDLPCQVRLIQSAPAPTHIDALIKLRISEFVDAIATDQPLFDIYHAQDCIGANALAQLKTQGVIAHFVRTVHHIEDYASSYLQACQDRSIRHPDLCLCVSDRWRQTLFTDYGIEAPKVINGVNLNRFSPQLSGRESALKQQLGIYGSPVFLTVGGIEPRKNSIRLLEAFAQVLAIHPQAQLIIAGGATLFDYQNYREQFFHRVDELRIEIGRSLILPGVLSDDELPIIYRCADAFCFPSLKEGWGLVVMEALASGLPLLLSQEPPCTEFIPPNQAEWIDPKSQASITEGLLKLASQKRLKSIQSQNQSLLAQYSWSQSAELHLVAYGRLFPGWG